MRGATCQLQWFSVYFAQLCHYGSQPIFSSFREIWLQLPDPGGLLSRLVPSSSIVSANEKVQSVLESKDRTQSGQKGQRYAELSPELKAEIGRRAAEHAATVRLYAIVGRWVWLT